MTNYRAGHVVERKEQEAGSPGSPGAAGDPAGGPAHREAASLEEAVCALQDSLQQSVGELQESYEHLEPAWESLRSEQQALRSLEERFEAELQAFRAPLQTATDTAAVSQNDEAQHERSAPLPHKQPSVNDFTNVLDGEQTNLQRLHTAVEQLDSLLQRLRDDVAEHQSWLSGARQKFAAPPEAPGSPPTTAQAETDHKPLARRDASPATSDKEAATAPPESEVPAQPDETLPTAPSSHSDASAGCLPDGEETGIDDGTTASSQAQEVVSSHEQAATLPEESLPEESLPGESLPGESLPGESLPGETLISQEESRTEVSTSPQPLSPCVVKPPPQHSPTSPASQEADRETAGGSRGIGEGDPKADASGSPAASGWRDISGWPDGRGSYPGDKPPDGDKSVVEDDVAAAIRTALADLFSCSDSRAKPTLPPQYAAEESPAQKPPEETEAQTKDRQDAPEWSLPDRPVPAVQPGTHRASGEQHTPSAPDITSNNDAIHAPDDDGPPNTNEEFTGRREPQSMARQPQSFTPSTAVSPTASAGEYTIASGDADALAPAGEDFPSTVSAVSANARDDSPSRTNLDDVTDPATIDAYLERILGHKPSVSDESSTQPDSHTAPAGHQSRSTGDNASQPHQHGRPPDSTHDEEIGTASPVAAETERPLQTESEPAAPEGDVEPGDGRFRECSPNLDDCGDAETGNPAQSRLPVDKESIRADMSSMRELANQQARAALATHRRSRKRTPQILAASVAVLATMISLALLTSELWSPVSLVSLAWSSVAIASLAAVEFFRTQAETRRLLANSATTEMPPSVARRPAGVSRPIPLIAKVGVGGTTLVAGLLMLTSGYWSSLSLARYAWSVLAVAGVAVVEVVRSVYEQWDELFCTSSAQSAQESAEQSHGNVEQSDG